MTLRAASGKPKFLGSGGSMVAKLKLKGIDGRAPPGEGALQRARVFYLSPPLVLPSSERPLFLQSGSALAFLRVLRTTGDQ